MSSTITFTVMSNGQDYQFELIKDLCNWDYFYETLSKTLPQHDVAVSSPLYYFDGNNVSHTVTDTPSFTAMISDATQSKNNVIQLYNGENFGATRTTAGEWIFAPEEVTMHDDIDPSSSAPTDGAPFADLYSTSFGQLGQVIHKHRSLIDSTPHLRMLIGRFASSLAVTPDAEMITRLDQYLDSYNNKPTNEDGTDGRTRGKEKSRHCGRRGRHQRNETECNNRREFIASIPDELAQFLLSSGMGRRGRHHHGFHGSHSPDHPGLGPSFFTGGMHKHHHHHEHHHPSYYPPFGFGKSMGPPGTDAYPDMRPGCGGPSPFFDFGGRHGGFPMNTSCFDRHAAKHQWKHALKQQWKQSMKEHHRGRHPYRYPMESSSSSSDTSDSSSSDNEDKKAERKEAAERYHQQRKLWKSLAKEHGRRHGPHGRMHGLHHGPHHHGLHHHGPHHHGPHHHGRHGSPGPQDPSMYSFAGRPHPPPPGYIEDSFNQLHLGDSKKH